MTRRPPRSIRHLSIALLGCVALVAGVVAGFAATADRRSGWAYGAGAAWLTSEGIGSVTLVDASSARVVTNVRVGADGHELMSVQDELTAYAVDRTTGHVARIDGATRDTPAVGRRTEIGLPGVRIFAADRSPSRPAAEGLNVLYAYPNRVGGVGALDPANLEARQLAALGGETGTGLQIVVDDRERAWSLDPARGRLAVRPPGGGQPWQPPASAGLRLLSAGAAPAVVDLLTGRVTWLDGDGGLRRAARTEHLPGNAGRAVADPATGDVYLAAPRGEIVSVCRAADGTCRVVANLAGLTRLAGPLAVVNGRVLVPDLGSGKLWVVTPGRPAVDVRVFPGATQFEVLVRNGLVFLNQPTTPWAAVLWPDEGRLVEVTKYTTKAPEPTRTRPPPSASHSAASPSRTPEEPSSTRSRSSDGPTTRPPSPTSSRDHGGGGGGRSGKPSTTTTTRRPRPSTSTEPPRVDPDGSIGSPRSGARVPRCQLFSGSVELNDDETLILAARNLDNPDAGQYAELVEDWKDPEQLVADGWRGLLFFNEGARDGGQRFVIRLMVVDLDEARAHRSNPSSLIDTARSLDSMRVKASNDVPEESGGCNL